MEIADKNLIFKSTENSIKVVIPYTNISEVSSDIVKVINKIIKVKTDEGVIKFSSPESQEKYICSLIQEQLNNSDGEGGIGGKWFKPDVELTSE